MKCSKKAGTALAVITLSLNLSCVVGPRYVRPSVDIPSTYKEGPPLNLSEWKTAEPKDNEIRGNWWESFEDRQLNLLEQQAGRNNQDIAAAAAKFLSSRALIRQARSQYFPTITGGAAVTNSRLSNFGPYAAGVSFTTYSLPFDASWEPDLWGRVRHSVEANSFAAQASAADLQNVRLTIQAEIAIDYYELRTEDALKRLFDSSVAAYADTVRLTRAQYRGGVGTDEAVAQAETQLNAMEAQEVAITAVRTQYQDALAVLVGQSPSRFSISEGELPSDPPSLPTAIPSALLERRADIASAERLVAQANAQIGMARAAFFPNITLSGSAGFTGLSAADWLAWPSRVWSVGPSLAETIFDAGLRRATVQQYRAAYDEAVANYRQTVLTPFRRLRTSWQRCACCQKKLRSKMPLSNLPSEASRRLRPGIERDWIRFSTYLRHKQLY